MSCREYPQRSPQDHCLDKLLLGMYTWLINHLNLPEYYHHSLKIALPFLPTSPYRHEKSDTAYLHSSNIKHLIRTALMFSVDALVSPIVHVKTCAEFYSFMHIKLARDFSINEFICFSQLFGLPSFLFLNFC